MRSDRGALSPLLSARTYSLSVKEFTLINNQTKTTTIMRKFTNSLLTLAFLLVAISGSAKTEKVHATFENPSNTNTTWNAETKTFTWSTTYYNQWRNIGLPSGDISKYKKLVVDCDIKSGEKFRVLFYKGGSNLTLWAVDGVNEFILADALKEVSPNEYNQYLLACDEICLSGSNAAAPGEVVINSVYLETYPANENVDIPEIEYEEDPGKPEGNFVDFKDAFPDLQPRIGLGADEHPIVLGNGEVIVGARSKNVIADLSAYSKLTIVTSP
jgi:phosphoribosyl-AMP cyclohydrolase